MSDALVAPVWLAVHIFLLCAGWQYARRAFREASCFLRIAATVVFWWAALTVVGLLLGMAGVLTGPNLLTGYGTFAVAAVLLLRFGAVNTWLAGEPRLTLQPPLEAPLSPSSLPAEGAREEVPKEAPQESLQEAPPPSETGQPPSEGRLVRLFHSERFWLALWGLWLAYAASKVAVLGLLRFPTEWDTLMYHLSLVDQWLRAASLYAPDDAVWYTPASSEIITLSMVAPFSGDFLYSLQNLPVTVLVVAAAIEVGAALGLSRPLCHLTALTMVSNGVVFKQIVDAKNDVAVLGLFLACVAFGFHYASRLGRGGPSLFFAALAFGLLCGIKYYAVGYAGMAWLAVVFAVWWLRGFVPAFKIGTGLIVAALVLAGYWYARNAMITGTPVYPKGITASSDVVHRINPNLWGTTFFGNGNPEVFPLIVKALQRMAGPGNIAAFLVLPLTLAWLLAGAALALLQSEARTRSCFRCALAILTLASLVVIGATPFTVETVPGTLSMLRDAYLPVRFALPFLACTLFCLALFLDDIVRWLRGLAARRASGEAGSGRRFPRIALSAAAMTPVLLLGTLAAIQLGKSFFANPTGGGWERSMVFLNLVFLGTNVAILWSFRRPLDIACLALLLVAALAGVGWGVSELSERWHAGYARHYDTMFKTRIFQSLETMQDDKDLRVCVFGNRYYPFLGSRRQFSVCRPVYLLSLENVFRYLRDEKITLLAAVHVDHFGNKRYERRGDWLADYPHLFEMYQNSNYYGIWRVRRQALENESLWMPSSTLPRSSK